ncbi:MAG: aminoacyl-tRNA hydrolase [Bacteroidota bacterium]
MFRPSLAMGFFSRLFGRPIAPSASPEVLLVGLGNPGPQYAGTRHNVGFAAIERLADRLGVALTARVDDACVATARLGADGPEVLLAKPQLYMNRSGGPTATLLRRYGIPPDRLLVLYDDLALDVGALRLRPKGGAGGHNGLQDVIRALGSTEFPRLRLGVGNSFESGQQVDYVLSPFSEDQREAAAEMVGRAAEAALAFATDGLDAAMNRFNRR